MKQNKKITNPELKLASWQGEAWGRWKSNRNQSMTEWHSSMVGSVGRRNMGREQELQKSGKHLTSMKVFGRYLVALYTPVMTVHSEWKWPSVISCECQTMVMWKVISDKSQFCIAFVHIINALFWIYGMGYIILLMDTWLFTNKC